MKTQMTPKFVYKENPNFIHTVPFLSFKGKRQDHGTFGLDPERVIVEIDPERPEDDGFVQVHYGTVKKIFF